MNIAIIDDEKEFLKEFRKILNENFKYNNMKIDQFIDFNEKFLEKQYDLIFLDVRLKDRESFLEGEKILKMNSKSKLVYISNYSDYVFDSQKQNVFYFVRKTHLIDDLTVLFNKYDLLNEKYNRIIEAQYMMQKFKIAVGDIIYIETVKRQNKVLIYMTDRTVLEKYTSLKNIYKELDNNMFYKLNAHIIINLLHVGSVEDRIVMNNESIIEYTRYSKNKFIKAYMNYKQNILWIG